MTLTGTTTPGQSGPGSNGNERLFYSSRNGDTSYLGHCFDFLTPCKWYIFYILRSTDNKSRMFYYCYLLCSKLINFTVRYLKYYPTPQKKQISHPVITLYQDVTILRERENLIWFYGTTFTYCTGGPTIFFGQFSIWLSE